MSHANTVLGSLVAAALLASTVARADDVGSLLEVLDENVVTGASRTAERASDAPATSTTITSEQLRRFGVRRIEDAINLLSLGMVVHDRMSTSEVGARGVALTRDRNSHTLVLLDGMVMNEQGGGAVYMHDIPIEVVDHIEVILGPGSVLYGAQAMFGVINVVTKNAESYAGIHAGVTAGLMPPFRTQQSLGGGLGWDNRYTAGFGQAFTLFGQPASFVGQLEHTQFNGPSFDFSYQQLPTRADGTPSMDVGPNGRPGFWGGTVNDQWFRQTTGLFTKVDIGDVSWTTRLTRTSLGMPQMDLFENRVGGAYDDTRNENQYLTLLSNLRYTRRLTERLSAMGRVYVGNSSTTYERHVLAHDTPIAGTPLGVVDPDQCPIGPLGPCRKESEFPSRWLGSELQATYDWTGTGEYTTMAGVDARYRSAGYDIAAFDVESGKSYGSDSAYTRWHGGGSKSASETAVGAYLQQVARPWSFLAINAGVRADYDSRIDTKYIGNAISPRLALIYQPTSQLSLKAIYSRAFRAPSFLELYVISGRLLSNPTLRPENVSSYEGIGTLRFGFNTISLGGFYSEWDNLIELQILKAQAPSASRYNNVSQVVNFGGNVAWEAAVLSKQLKLGLNGTIASARRRLSDAEQARNASEGDSVPVTVAPNWFGNARASYELGDNANTAVALAVGVVGPRIADQAYYGGDRSNLDPLPKAPTQVDLRAVLTSSVPALHGLSYSLGASYTIGTTQPYVVGPSQGLPRYLVPETRQAELLPVNHFTMFAGIAVDMDPFAKATPSPTATKPAPVAAAPKAAATRHPFPKRPAVASARRSDVQ